MFGVLGVLVDVRDVEGCWLSQVLKQTIRDALQAVALFDKLSGKCKFVDVTHVLRLKWVLEFVDSYLSIAERCQKTLKGKKAPVMIFLHYTFNNCNLCNNESLVWYLFSRHAQQIL